MGTYGVNRLDGSALRPIVKVGDVGTALVIRILDTGSDAWDPLVDPVPPPFDISAQTAMVMRFSKPGDNIGDPSIVVEKTATFATASGLPGFVGDGTDGYVQYKTEIDFLDRPGRWRREARITLPDGVITSETVDFDVQRNL